jgi:hypothetical protein
MTRREELQKQWAEYERRLDAVHGTKPESEVFEEEKRLTAVYSANGDTLKINLHDGYYNPVGSVTLSGDEAEKLYHFLGGLYGGTENQGSCVQAEI